MHHELKILPVYFQAHIDGNKPFEIRDNSDRGFQKGDTVTLVECVDGSITTATGRKVTREITYVTNYGQTHEMVVIGLREQIDNHSIIDFIEWCSSYNGDGSALAETYREIVADMGRKARLLLAEINNKGCAE